MGGVEVKDRGSGNGRRSAAAALCLILSLALVAAVSSCALFHGGEGGRPAYGPVQDETERDQYDALEYLEEHPLDLMTADPGELRSLPGFPERLIERLMDERPRNGTPRRLFEALTPPEQAVLRRYEAYLDLPGRFPLGFETRLTADRLGPEAERRDEARIACRGEMFRFSARYRSDEIYRAYLGGFLPSRHVRLHMGDIVPDLGMGLCFSSYTTSYPFSHGYHIRGRDRVAGTTSLYGESMRGGAAELWAGPVRLLILGGRRCSYANGVLDTEGPVVACGRLASGLGGFSAGATVHTTDGFSGEPVYSADASWSRGRIDAAAELATGDERPNGVWALSVRGDVTRISMLLYDIEPGWDGPMGRSFYGSGMRRRGCSILLERRLGRGIRLFTAFERSNADDPYDVKVRDLIRFESRWAAGGNSVKLSLKRRIERRSVLIPFPTYGEGKREEVSDSIQLLQRWRLPAALHLRVSLRSLLERGRSGYLICPSLTIDRWIDATLAWAVHRAVVGTPVFYCYERSLKGQYPWRALRGDGWRVALFAGASIGPLRIAICLAAQSGERYEAATQVYVKL